MIRMQHNIHYAYYIVNGAMPDWFIKLPGDARTANGVGMLLADIHECP